MSNWPQYTYLALTLFGLGICLMQHGKPREPLNFGTTVVSSSLIWFLLYMGGFFDRLLK
jgi:hypothetical protein